MKKFKTMISITAAAAIAVLLTACGSTVYYTADDCVNVTVSGADGSGTSNVSFDKQTLLEKINNDIYKGKADDMELAKAEVALYQYVKIEVPDDNNGGLSNGDKIVVNVTADNEALKEMGFGIDEQNSVYVYTVEGLLEPTVIDLFKDVTVTMDGASPFLKATNVEYTGDDEFIKNYVKYRYDYGTNFANGDSLHVTANVNQSRLDEYNYVVEATEKDFEISGYDKYTDTDSDMTAANEYINEYAHSLLEKDGGVYTVGWEKDARAFFEDGSSFELWKVTSQQITPVKAVMYTNEDSYKPENNSYNIFYRIDMEIEKTGTQYGNPQTDYEIGDKETSEIYFCIALNDVTEKTDGTLEFDEEDTEIITYSTSLLHNYVGASLDDVAAARDEEMYGYIHSDMPVPQN